MANDDTSLDRNPAHDDAAIATKEEGGKRPAERTELEIRTLVQRELAAVVPVGITTRLMSISSYELEKVYWIAGILFFVVLILKALRS